MCASLGRLPWAARVTCLVNVGHSVGGGHWVGEKCRQTLLRVALYVFPLPSTAGGSHSGGQVGGAASGVGEGSAGE